MLQHIHIAPNEN